MWAGSPKNAPPAASVSSLCWQCSQTGDLVRTTVIAESPRGELRLLSARCCTSSINSEFTEKAINGHSLPPEQKK